MKDFTIISHDRRRLRDLLPLSKPLSLFVEPTNLCNFRCTPCVHGSDNTRNDLKPLGNMDLSLFKKIIAELSEWPGPPLKLLRLALLGEPFLNPDFCEMVKIAHNAKVAERIDTFTNGSLLTREICEKVVDSGLHAIRVSIYAADDLHHEEVTRSRIGVVPLRDKVALLRQIRDSNGLETPYIFVKMFDTYSEENDRFQDLYRDVADEIGFEQVHNATNYSGNDLVKLYYKDAEKEKFSNQQYLRSLNSNRVACSRPFMSMSINSHGDCLMCTHDPSKGTKIGNVNESTLRELWSGKNMFEFRRMLLEGRKHENRVCAGCDWFKLFPEEDNIDGFSVEALRP